MLILFLLYKFAKIENIKMNNFHWNCGLYNILFLFFLLIFRFLWLIEFQSISSVNDREKGISPISSIIKNYLIVIICVGILLTLFIFVGWFMCRNCEMADNHFNNSARKFNSTIVTPDSDTSCSTCEMKLKLNSLEFARRNQRPVMFFFFIPL